MKLFSQSQRNYKNEGANQDQKLGDFVKKSIGVTKRKVEAKKNTIISGPPGVGKTYRTMAEIRASGKKHITIQPGAKEAAIAAKLAYAVYTLKDDEELVVLVDDADDILFKDKATCNQWKLAFAKEEPVYARDVDMTGQFSKWKKEGKDKLIEAVKSFQEEGSLGLSIPLDNVRFIVLCNKNYGDSKSVRANIRTDVEAIIDRVRYRRLDFEWKVSWGWLAHVLETSQPFEDQGVELDDEQKAMISTWLWDKWEIMRNTSYRTVEELAEYMVDDPEDYIDEWETFLVER